MIHHRKYPLWYQFFTCEDLISLILTLGSRSYKILHHDTIVPAKSEVATPNGSKEMQSQENTLFDLGVKVTQNVAHFPLHHVICEPTKFEVATPNDLRGDAFAKNVTGGTNRRTDDGPTLVRN